MESFYGGRQGASFVIKGRFKYITDAKVNGKYVDEYYGQAYEEGNELRAYETNPSGYPQEKIAYLPKNPKTGAVYSSEDWFNELQAETMSIQLNNYHYKYIWYGEYCIIDPKNKNNKNNGKIYRRTLKGAGDEDITGNVAEYIGQIVGPAGPATILKDIDGVEATEEKFQNLSLGLDDSIGFYNQSNTWDTGKDLDDKLWINKLGKKVKLIPGSVTKEDNPDYREEYFDNSILAENDNNNRYLQNGGYTWYNVRLNTSTEDISEIQIGFDFPYYVTDFVSGEVLPDIGEVEVIKQINTVAEPYGTAPFYEKYKINVPRGLRGGWFENIRSVKRESGKNYYLPTAISYKEPTYTTLSAEQKDWQQYPTSVNNHYTEDEYSFTETEIVSTEEWPIGANGWIATFCWRTPNKQQRDFDEEPGIVHKIDNIFLGLNRDIANITFSDTGTLTFEYTSWNQKSSVNAPNDDTPEQTAGVRVDGQSLDYLPQFETWIKKVDWITKIEVDQSPSVNYGERTANLLADDAAITQGDNLKLTFNNNTVSGTDNGVYQKNLRTIAGIKTFDDGSVRVYRSDGSKDSFDKRINWITDIETDKVEGKDWTKKDTLTIQTNNDNINNIEKNLRLINSIKLYDNGVLETVQSDGTIRSSEKKNSNEIIDDNREDLGPQLSWIKQVYRIDSNEPYAYYYDENATNHKGNKVDPFHLLIRFNNLTPGNVTGLKRVKMIDPTINNQSEDKWPEDWFDLGVVQQTIDGIEFTQEEVVLAPYIEGTSQVDENYRLYSDDSLNYAIQQLNTDDRYKNGLNGKALIAEVVTQNGENILSSKTVIFYYVSGENGSYTGWKRLSSIENTSSVVIDGTDIQGTENAIHFAGEEINTWPWDLYHPWYPTLVD